MKITKKKLHNIIKEELKNVLEQESIPVTADTSGDASGSLPDPDDIVGALRAAQANLSKSNIRKAVDKKFPRKNPDEPVSDEDRQRALAIINKEDRFTGTLVNPDLHDQLKTISSTQSGTEKANALNRLFRLALDTQQVGKDKFTVGAESAKQAASAVAKAAMDLATKHQDDELAAKTREYEDKVINPDDAALDQQLGAEQAAAELERQADLIDQELDAMFAAFDKAEGDIIDRLNGPGKGRNEATPEQKAKARELAEKAFLPAIKNLLQKGLDVMNQRGSLSIQESNSTILANHRESRGVHPVARKNWWYNNEK